MTTSAPAMAERPSLRRYILTETIVGVVINTAISLAITWLAFHGYAQVPTHGGLSLVTDAIPQSFMVVLMSVLPVSLLTRARARKGRLLPSAPRGGWSAPPKLAVRAVGAALLAAVIGYLGFLALAPLLAPDGVPVADALVLKAVYGAALSVLVIPFAAIAALKDVA